MARKLKPWTPWKLVIGKYTLYRRVDGTIECWRDEVCVADWSPTEARRLFLALKKDYLD